MKYLPFFTYILCINLTVKAKKKRVYLVFIHRVSWGGSRKLTTFTIELFLIIVNGLRCLLKIWQGSWIHFKFFLPFTSSYVIHFISFYFERIFKYKPYRYLCFVSGSILNVLTLKFKDVSKYNYLQGLCKKILSYHGVIAHSYGHFFNSWLPLPPALQTLRL